MGDGAEEWSKWDCVIMGLKCTIDTLCLGGLDQPIDVSLDSTFFAISPTMTTPLPVT